MRSFTAAGLVAVLYVSLASFAAAQPTPAPASIDAHLTAAIDLARLVNESNDLESQAERMLTSIATQGFAADPNLAALKEQFPGIEKVFLDTLRPVMMSELTLMLPEYNRAIGEFYAANFTTAEIGELTTFWRSDAGQTLLRSVGSSIDFAASSKEMVAQMNDDGPTQISSSAIRADTRAAATKGLREMTPQQRVAIMRFGLTPTGRKMTRLVDKKNEIERQWMNRGLSPGTEERIETDLGNALIAFIEEQERQQAAAP